MKIMSSFEVCLVLCCLSCLRAALLLGNLTGDISYVYGVGKHRFFPGKAGKRPPIVASTMFDVLDL
jgi:hypothetical protein